VSIGKIYYRILSIGSALIGLHLITASVLAPSPGLLRLAFTSPVGERPIAAALGLACLLLGVFLFRLPRRPST
jgi:hypothetical protein